MAPPSFPPLLDTGRPQDPVLEELEFDADGIDQRAKTLTRRYWGRERNSYWNADRIRLDNRLGKIRDETAGFFPSGMPPDVTESLSRIEFRALRFYSEIGWDDIAHRRTQTFLRNYPNSSLWEEARQRFLSRKARDPIQAFFHTTLLESAETPLWLSTIGSALGCFIYFLASGRRASQLTYRNPSLLAVSFLGSLISSLAYAIRPPAWGGRTWRAAYHQTLYGEKGDLSHALKRLVFKTAATSFAVGLFSKQAVAPLSWCYRSGGMLLKRRRVGGSLGMDPSLDESQPWTLATDTFLQGVQFHTRSLGETVVEATRSSRGFGRSLSQADPWLRMRGWFLAPSPGDLLRIIRIGGLVGGAFNLFDFLMPDGFGDDSAVYQSVRMVGGALMTLCLVELTATTMGLLRPGAYLNAVAETANDLVNQLQTTKPEDYNFFRTAAAILRTAFYKKALDVGSNFAVARRLADASLRTPGSIPDPAQFAGGWFNQRLTDQFFAITKQQGYWTRFLIALEATPITAALSLFPYTLEGLAAGVNPTNYTLARIEQLIWPSTLMQFVTAGVGNYTRIGSILANKYLLFPIFGQASYVCHPRYAGEPRGMKNFIDDLKAAGNDPERRDAVIRRHLVKNFGHSEGGLFNHNGTFGYDQFSGYLRASRYTLTDDGQPLGAALNAILRPFGISLTSLADTLFTPDQKSYRSLYQTVTHPDPDTASERDAQLVVEALDQYLRRHPPPRVRPKPGDVKGWEDWTLARSLAILAALSAPGTPLERLRENPRMKELEGESYRYLAGTVRLDSRGQLQTALRRLTHEAVANFEGRRAYATISRDNRRPAN